MQTWADPTATVTLSDPLGACEFRRVPDDVVRAVVGEDIWRAAHEGASVQRGTVTVVSIDRAAGVLTLDRSPAIYAGPLGDLRPVSR